MKKISKVIKIIIIVMLISILLVNISIIVQSKVKPDEVPGIFGYKPFIVLSGSMESQINVGDLVIVKDVDTSTLKKDDVIAFRDTKDIVTTHRIKEVIIEDGETCFITKGDANNTEDQDFVYPDMVEGVYKTRIAKLGKMILFIQQPLGFTILMMSIFIFCILIYIYQNRKIDQEFRFKNEEERKAYEEFIKSRENNK